MTSVASSAGELKSSDEGGVCQKFSTEFVDQDYIKISPFRGPDNSCELSLGRLVRY